MSTSSMIRRVRTSRILRSTRRICLGQERRATRSFSSNYEDPQAEASKRIDENAGSLSGIEAVSAMPASIHRANYATAAGLLGFVGYVFWYSMNAVGQNSEQDDPLATLQKEAAEARAIHARKESAASDLAQMDIGLDIEDGEGQRVTVAVAAPDDIAMEEEEHNQNVRETNGKKGVKRSLINRIIFFWK
mmetsp:Transcript_40633/g.46193  ORF Transcript_40633/g.46193 Transcript_40633/m.46193 type:complete len:190 (+) Transcript_40633:132-701(+)|eukprot:CAMPEP_0194146688 /NCGR_PEP_ID=MMETSP0152-20130528/21341_1 /TAXON_ID=1049557 /ORGANISM="Thalassiothrix antarctica, Strain L6-D1" /LENGTH=189 /DNA_ID=CAMNT_0038847265 /DNA_START=72 /DNA_END=641 /DNA_ORIENTATION=+